MFTSQESLFLLLLILLGLHLAEFYPITVIFRYSVEPIRTAVEVRRFLESRSWYHEWVSGLEQSSYDKDDREAFLEGEYYERSVTDAFNWDSTPQGHDVWSKRCLEFISWYRGDTDSFPEGNPDGPSGKEPRKT